jgi:hypothetical protein
METGTTHDDGYAPPAPAEIGDHAEPTLGLRWGRPQDVFGSRTPCA